MSALERIEAVGNDLAKADTLLGLLIDRAMQAEDGDGSALNGYLMLQEFVDRASRQLEQAEQAVRSASLEADA
jgi:hypothetical protein